MRTYSGLKNRRSDSQIQPRLFLLLQVAIMAQLSYISFTILTALGMSTVVIASILVITNCYFLSKVFVKCRSIAKRNHYTNYFQTY